MKCLLLFLSFVLLLKVTAQEKLVVYGKAPDSYLIHLVKEGESLQSIGNRFGSAPAKIAAYNNLNPASPLTKNFQIRIPLTKDILLQDNVTGNQPVYHIIGKGDNLYRLSLAYNKVSIASLKEWNQLKNDIVKDGQYVIIGYLADKSTADVKKENKLKPGLPNNDNPVVKPTPALVKPIEKKKTELVADSALAKTKVPMKITIRAEETPSMANAGYQPKEGDEGYFAVAYSQHDATQLKQFRSGDAGTFKTISGWTDHKYYVLIDEVVIGTIVRITGINNKNICAKVLGPLPADTKNGSALLLRMSNAAAAALGATEQKFTITITYFE